MTNANSTSNTKESQAWTFNNALISLWHNSEIKDKETLQQISRFQHEAQYMALNLKSTVEGLGCLIADDEKVGYFQDNASVSTLLFNISNQLDLMSGLMFVGSEAQYLLNEINTGVK